MDAARGSAFVVSARVLPRPGLRTGRHRHLDRAAGGGRAQLRISLKFGTTLVPDTLMPRQSQDGRMHVCMSCDEFGNKEVLCFFAPPSM
jgi:hypothetical protein